MNRKTGLFGVMFLFWINLAFAQAKINLDTMETSDSNFALVIHGGAGNINRNTLKPEKEQEYRNKLSEALKLGYSMLSDGDSAIKVVEAVIKVLEDSRIFNAGAGSVFSHEGRNEMDAAIMDGKTLYAGAVAGVRTIKNPISAARVVMEKSQFVFLSGHGAEEFAKEQNLEIVDTSYFFTKERWEELLRVRDSANAKNNNSDTMGYIAPSPTLDKYGTVGCVVRDKYGNLAAGTSTGGIVNKKFNRIGDSPLIGCGTYANNKTCAVSCTGHGEDFIRLVAAYDVSALMQYRHKTLGAAAEDVILKKLNQIGGRGGLIAIDRHGNIAMPFNTNGMFRGFVNKSGKVEVFIFKEEGESQNKH